MKKTVTILLCLCFVVISFAQKENPMTKEKGKRTVAPVDLKNLKNLKDLNPIKIDGRNAQNPNPQPTNELTTIRTDHRCHLRGRQRHADTSQRRLF